MKPGSFDPRTSRIIIGDARANQIEAKARADADIESFAPPDAREGSAYWDSVVSSAELIVYTTQYRKRIARNQRKKEMV